MKPFPAVYCAALSLLLLTCLPGIAQTTDTMSIKSIIDKTESFNQKFPQEKIHVHFDKPYYAAGDTMWFKAYVTSAIRTATQLSKIVYVDIIKNRDSLVTSIKLPVLNGVAWGNIVLDPTAYPQGNYQIVAYTRWMMNFDPAYFFRKQLIVGNSQKELITNISFVKKGNITTARISYKSPEGLPLANKKVEWEIAATEKPLKGKATTDPNGIVSIDILDNQSKSLADQSLKTYIDLNKKTVGSTFALAPAASGIDLQFFPEGGDMIAGVPSKVAFKALKADGFGIEVKGTLADNEGKIITDFASQHLGMGAFVLVPESGKAYTATISLPNGQKIAYKLPDVKESGIKLIASANSAAAQINLRLICNPQFLAANAHKAFYILVQSAGAICYAAQATLEQPLSTIAIPKEKLPTGVAQITLLAASGQPLSERLIFVNNADALDLSLKADKTVYSRRQKVRLNIAAKSNKLPAEANLSLSVIDESKTPFDENVETTILSNLLLTSDLKGYIEKPAYYFNRPTESTLAALDVLMLTQGYRRFSYKDVIAGKNPTIYFLPEQGIEISGTMRTSTGMPVNKGEVRLRIPDKSYSTFTVTSPVGVFKFPNLSLADSSEVIVSSADFRYKNPMMTLNPVDMKPVLSNMNWPAPVLNIDSSMSAYLQNSKNIFKNSHTLKDIVITAKAPSNAPSHSDYPSLSGLNMPDHLISKDRFSNCPNFLSCLQVSTMGVTYLDNNFYVTRDYNMGNKTPMQVFYNGMPVDVSFLNSIVSTDIESVEIFLKDELGLVARNYNANGVLVINGKKVEKKQKMSMAEIQSLLPKPGEVKITPQGYARAREFYSPKYSVPPGIATSSDLRTTIYWNPKLKTDKATGNTAVEYFNADGKGTYTAILEGMDAEGHIGRSVFRYKVE